MRVIVGAGAAGLALARSLRRRGVSAEVLDRGARGACVPPPFMPPCHGFDALADAGVLEPAEGAHVSFLSPATIDRSSPRRSGRRGSTPSGGRSRRCCRRPGRRWPH